MSFTFVPRSSESVIKLILKFYLHFLENSSVEWFYDLEVFYGHKKLWRRESIIVKSFHVFFRQFYKKKYLKNPSVEKFSVFFLKFDDFYGFIYFNFRFSVLFLWPVINWFVFCFSDSCSRFSHRFYRLRVNTGLMWLISCWVWLVFSICIS